MTKLHRIVRHALPVVVALSAPALWAQSAGAVAETPMQTAFRVAQQLDQKGRGITADVAKRIPYLAGQFTRIDADGNHRISAVELQRHIQQQVQHFAQLDRNRDGHLTPAELKRAPELAPHFKALDLNQDGRLSTVEFEQWGSTLLRTSA